MQYFFNDQLRWSLGWETPNQAGAFLATLLPWLWGLAAWLFARALRPEARRLGWVVGVGVPAAAEIAVSWALVKTYSRGAFVAVIAALGLVVAVELGRLLSSRQRHAEAERPGGLWRLAVSRLAPWLGRAALLAVLLAVSGLDRRLEPDYAATDHSVTNRVDLWKGGLELAAISPWRGWGWGNSGASFMHWTQPIGRTEGYKSMVNSYLTVGVEGGLPVLAGVLVVALFLLFTGLRGMLGGASLPWLALASGASWLAWLVALFFSNLWIIPCLWIVPGLTMLFLGWRTVRAWEWRSDRIGLVAALAVAVLVCGCGWTAGARWNAASPVVIARAADGEVTLAKRSVVAGPLSSSVLSLVVLPDSQVLGEAYGQELRRWVLAADAPAVRLRVIDSSGLALPSGCQVVVFGAACDDGRLEGRSVVLVHPVQSPDGAASNVGPGSIVQLAGIDVAGANAAWEDWAAAHNLTVRRSPGLATDARAGWPSLALSWWGQ